MQKTIKVKLDDYQDWATRIRCCGNQIWFNGEELIPSFMGYCKACNKPIVIVADDGIAYYVGPPVFDRNRT